MQEQYDILRSKALKKTIRLNTLTLACALMAAVFSYFSYSSLQELQQASNNRYHSYLLTEQLRLSSDQLTLMARTYAVTGQEKYLDFFNQILDIRNGRRARPENYHRVYWDMLMPEQGKAPFSNGQRQPLQQLMKQAGFSELEFAQLQQAQQASDKLTELEFRAFNEVKDALSLPAPYKLSPGRETALGYLYSQDYLTAKARIMSHINEFYSLQENRTNRQVVTTANKHSLMTALALASFIALLLILLLNFRLRHKVNRQFIDLLEQEVNTQTEHIRAKNAQLTESLEIMETAKNQLVESEKMASLGSLVAGVAHEINTPIGVGITAVTTLQEEIALLRESADNNSLTKNLLVETIDIFQHSTDMIFSNLARVSSLIKSFKHVAVDQAHDEIRSLELRESVQDVIDSIMPKYKYYRVKVKVGIDSRIQCKTYPGALAQIVTNLVINAFLHAFDKEQTGEININADEQNGQITLFISDNGKGMDTQTREKIFEPFYTTKRNQGGTGLGMHIVFNLVTQKLSGQIGCDSEPGKGTRFTMTFPRQPEPLPLQNPE
ncbi:HAMP domain-containing histidine kinase [Thalassomonas viridans]|uniref:histidine kinase n=1 Tax=Thalassomonas viridans TaxID=137584 RepID=A0AAE9Z5V7_9GAMM|nr:HAMP domain-containing sensor histidine kinase [Thalassomonas viridans]WDE06832.1 HAMP domain-containing histidine kinase [Thalassomonas viridans]